MYSIDFLREIPKTDLHLHLDGSLRLSTLIDIAQKEGIELPSYTEQGMRDLVFKPNYNSLEDYLKGFIYTTSVFTSPENIERIGYELAQDNQAEGVRYIEVRFAPQLFMNNTSMSMENIFVALDKGLKRAAKEFNQRPEVLYGNEPSFRYGIIGCAMRMFGPHQSVYYRQLFEMFPYHRPKQIFQLAAMELAKGMVKIRDRLGIPIVGYDLAGPESGYPAEDYLDVYRYIHKNFMQKTVHAGEAYGAESIFQSITDLNADRLGHGFYLFDQTKVVHPDIKDRKTYIENLASFVANRRIAVEVCLTSNLQTNPELIDIKDHSLKDMLDWRIATTLCTDNRLVSNTTVTNEYRLAVENFDIPPKILKDIVAYGFEQSFNRMPYIEKRKYSRQVMHYYDVIAEKYSIA